MSSVDPVEEMEVEPMDTVKSPPEETDQAEVFLSLRWVEENSAQKNKVDLIKALQSWANKSNVMGNFDVLETVSHGAFIKTPPSVLVKLEKASGQMLINKGTKIATLVSVHRRETLCPTTASLSVGPQGFQQPTSASLSEGAQGFHLPTSASLSVGPQEFQLPTPASLPLGAQGFQLPKSASLPLGPQGFQSSLLPVGPQGFQLPTSASLPLGPQGFQQPTSASLSVGPQEIQQPTSASLSVGPQGFQLPISSLLPVGPQGFQLPTSASLPLGPQGFQQPTSASLSAGPQEIQQPTSASLSVGPQGFQLPKSASLPLGPQGFQLPISSLLPVGPPASVSVGAKRPHQPPQYSAMPMVLAGALQSAPMKHLSLQQEAMQMEQQGSPNHPQADSAVEEETLTCNVPIAHYWFVSHIYKQDIARIEKENGVKIQAEVTIKLEPLKKNGDPRKAYNEFTNLIQTSSSESEGFSIDLKRMSPEAWKDTLDVLQKKANKVLLRVSSEEMFVCGPGHSQDAISQSLSTIQETSTDTKPSFMEPAPASSFSRPTFTMKIDDPLIRQGITVEESIWRQMTGPFGEQVTKLKDKFDVDFEEASNNEGQVNIKACYTRSTENTSMESHAIRALLHLYRRVMGFANRNHARGSSVIDHQPKGASGGPVRKAASEHSMSNTEKMLSEAAAEGEVEICVLCQDLFTDKVQLRCKHEFCKECLDRLKKIRGAVCPLCQDVFDVLEGNQPRGKMRWTTKMSSLPGYPSCGTIVIHYFFAPGIQTERHPNPGQPYSGTQRWAYLPNNSEGKEVLRLLERAFEQNLIFTIGRSITSNLDNQVTWNGIHHKTNESGGPTNYGYPDQGYLSRVKGELKDKGIE